MRIRKSDFIPLTQIMHFKMKNILIASTSTLANHYLDYLLPELKFIFETVLPFFLSLMQDQGHITRRIYYG
jgi:hypothetical protein